MTIGEAPAFQRCTAYWNRHMYCSDKFRQPGEALVCGWVLRQHTEVIDEGYPKPTYFRTNPHGPSSTLLD